nr:hypothetical protein GCM10020063_013360 [Dactylosporangium thailandense]
MIACGSSGRLGAGAATGCRLDDMRDLGILAPAGMPRGARSRVSGPVRGPAFTNSNARAPLLSGRASRPLACAPHARVRRARDGRFRGAGTVGVGDRVALLSCAP